MSYKINVDPKVLEDIDRHTKAGNKKLATKTIKRSSRNWFYSISNFKVLDLEFYKYRRGGSHGVFIKVQR